MKCGLSVVKLGGGVITVKSSPETVDYENLRLAASQLSIYSSSGGKLVLVHGGGSFGHYMVAKILREKGSMEVVDSSLVQDSMLRLAMIVTRILIEHGLKPVLHPPHSICMSVELETCNLGVIKRDLELGLTPVTYGDMIPEARGAKVISGDDLAAWISVNLKADCLIYVIREDGILDHKGDVIPLLTSLDQLTEIKVAWDDVTGGVRRKIEVALQASRIVPNVIVTSVASLGRVLRGEIAGTRVKAP